MTSKKKEKRLMMVMGFGPQTQLPAAPRQLPQEAFVTSFLYPNAKMSEMS
jgi:hypothetical protein